MISTIVKKSEGDFCDIFFRKIILGLPIKSELFLAQKILFGIFSKICIQFLIPAILLWRIEAGGEFKSLGWYLHCLLADELKMNQ